MEEESHENHALWVREVKGAIESLAASGAQFTSDDVWACVQNRTKRRNAIGPLLGAYAERGRIRQVGVRPSGRQSRRKARVRVWCGVPA